MKKERRNFFKTMSILGLGSIYTTSLYAKTSKKIVHYQATPKDGKKCQECLHFIAATNKCTTVEGDIDPNGWCTIYFKNPKLKK